MDVKSGLPGGSAGAESTMDYDDTNILSLDPSGVADDEPQKIPSPAQQADEIEVAEAKDISEGEQMYLVSEGWWAEWCAYTRYKQPAEQDDTAAVADGGSEAASGHAGSCTTVSTSEAPRRIDNRDIVFDSKLRDNLEEGRDFVIVTSDSWTLLQRWYGGGPAITRTAVMEGLAPNSKRPRVMLYPMCLEVCWGGKPNEVKTIEAEKHETVRILKERACAAFGVESDKVEIWDYFNHGKYANLDKELDKDLEAARILDQQPILLDDKDNPLPETNTTASSPIFTAGYRPARAASFAEDQSIQREGGRPGGVGLTNLGNTCFMNSSLQCLMHTVPIMRVFLTGRYEADINTVNPLGLKGQLAMALGNLMNSVWRAGVGSVSPRAFKSKIAQFAPQFSGYQQHDSQEFLAFLLDGLHEDINRILQKPYVEEPDSEGVPDEQLASIAWDNYRKRNDSHIVDHFQGLYKSTLVCPQCSYSSVKFDPFMYLSLPLPESKVKQLTAILLHADGSAPPREYGLEVPQSGTLKDLYVALARVAGLPPLSAPGQQMVAAQLKSRFSWSLAVLDDPGQRISELGRDIVEEVLLVYYYRDPDEGPGGRQGENRKVLIMHRHPGPGHHQGGRKFSAPLLLWLPPSETYDPQLHVRKLGGSSSKQLFGSSSGGRVLGGNDTEYALSEDAPLWRHVERMLQPFKAPAALCQPPLAPAAAPAAAGEGAAAEGVEGGSQEAAGHQQQQMDAAMATEQQPAASTGPGDESMAAVSPSAPSPSPEPCCTSQPPAAASVPAGVCAGGSSGAAAAAGAVSGAWGSDGGAADQTNNKAASEAGDNNSTWGSHGSEAAHSDMDADLGCEETIDEEVGISRAASQQQLTDGADAAAAGGAADMESDGEVDAGAALAAQQLGGTEVMEPPPAAAAATASAGGAGSGGGVLGTGCVPVAPLDIWSAQTQSATADTAAATSPQEEQQQQHEEPPTGMAPYYLLKLAQESGSTVVPSWLANQFHPNHHHFFFTLDWHKGAGRKLSNDEYLSACEAENAQLQQQLQQEASQQEPPAEQQQQQDGMQGTNQQQQQRPGLPFWIPDGSDPGSQVHSEEQRHEVVGAYVLSAMEQPQHDASVKPIHASRQDPKGKAVSLEDCVEAFLQPEQLSEADEWYCPKCRTHVQADKKLDLWRLPEVLVVHLKRFSYTRWNRDKLDTQVKFPLQGLDLSGYVLGLMGQTEPSEAPLYDCYAVSNHYGGLGGGHYTAFSQMPDDKKWYLFDDSRVEETPPEQVQSRAAYLLFYRRRPQAAADPPDLVQQLLEARQQHMQAKQEAAAAEAAAEAAAREAAAAAAGMGDADGADAMVVDTAAAAEQALVLIPASSPQDGWGSPAIGTPAGIAAAAAAAGEDIGGGLLGIGSPAPAAPAPAITGRPGPSRRLGMVEDSSDTSTSLRATGLEEEDSSDGGSSSRPRTRVRVGLAQRQREAAEAQAAAEAVDSWGPLQSRAALRAPRQSDQDVGDADMADRDV